jgi:hypothetical protein
MRNNVRTPDKVKRPKKSRLTKTRILALLAMAVLLAGVGTIVFSQSGQNKGKKKYVATKEIIFDQSSRQLRKPTVEETSALVDQVSTLTNRTSDGLIVNQASNGMKSVNLEGRFNGVTLGRANADGTTEIRCVFTIEEAADFLGLEESAQ